MTSDPVEWDDPRELAESDQLPEELPKPAVPGTGSSAAQREREAGLSDGVEDEADGDHEGDDRDAREDRERPDAER